VSHSNRDDEPLFTRQVISPCRNYRGVHPNQRYGSGVIYRPDPRRSTVPVQPFGSVGTSVALARSWCLLIHNQTARAARQIRARARSRFTWCSSRSKQLAYFLTGRRFVPRRDTIWRVGHKLKMSPWASINFRPFTDNPIYHAPEVLADLKNQGGRRRCFVSSGNSASRIKIVHSACNNGTDLEVALRAHWILQIALVRDGEQVPYLIEHTSVQRA